MTLGVAHDLFAAFEVASVLLRDDCEGEMGGDDPLIRCSGTRKIELNRLIIKLL